MSGATAVPVPVSGPTAMDKSEPLALLLIEDNPADSRLMQEHLRDAIQSGDVILQVVRCLSDAVQALRNMAYSCVLVDLGLPDGQGVTSIAALRAIDARIAMIVMTGMDNDDTARQAMQLDVQDYIVKARHDSGLLLRRIRFAVQNRRQRLALDAEPPAAFHRASRDPVTGLPNRWLFADRAEMALVQAERTKVGTALLSISFDGLPALDDQGQRPLAEEALRRIGGELQRSLRRSDTVAATDPGEFAVVLTPTGTRAEVELITQRLQRQLQTLELLSLNLRPHIGMALYPDDGNSWDVLIEQAEQTMFRARRQGVDIAASARPQSAESVPGRPEP